MHSSERYHLDQYSLPEDINYYAPNENWCDSAAKAYLMYRLGAPPRLWEPSAIDELTGRQAGERTSDDSAAWLALLSLGTTLKIISDFDDQRFIKEGKPYLDEFYADKWYKKDPAGFDSYWTAQRVEAEIASCEAFNTKARTYGKQWTVLKENPSLKHIERFNEDTGYLLYHRAKGGTASSSHSIVVLRNNLLEGNPNNRIVDLFDSNKVPPITIAGREFFEYVYFNPDTFFVAVELQPSP